MSSQPVEAFVSYAHKDEALRLALGEHLALLTSRGYVDVWHDRLIAAGENWEEAISSSLSRARLILLLVTPAFFSSGYCRGVELERALQRQRQDEAVVIPVIMKEGDYTGSPFSHLKELPTDGLAKGRSVTGKKWKNRDEAFRDVTEGIRRQLESLRTRRVVTQAAQVYQAKAGHPPSEDDRTEIAGLAQTFGRIVAGRQVLWVDDKPENNATEIAAFEELGVRVATALSTEEALAQLRSRTVHLLVSDWVRPSSGSGPARQAEGLRLLELMRAQGIHVPVIFYTGWLIAAELQSRTSAAAAAGATGITASPRELLRWSVGELVRSAALDPAAAFVDIPLYTDAR